MQNFLKKHTSYRAVIDYGEFAIKFALFSGFYSKQKITQLDLIETEDPLTPIGDNPNTTSLFPENLDCKKKGSFLILTDAHSSFSFISTPLVSKEEIKKGILLNPKDYFDNPIDDRIISIDFVNKVKEKRVLKQGVILSTIPKESINKATLFCDKIKFQPQFILPSAYILFQWMKEKLNKKNASTICVLDIGFKSSRLYILNSDYKTNFTPYCFVNHKIPIGGFHLTQSLTTLISTNQGKIQLNNVDAEKLKRDIDISALEARKLFLKELTTENIQEMLRSPLEQLNNEVKRCIDFYQDKNKDSFNNEILCIGGGAKLKGLSTYLTSASNLNYTTNSPFKDSFNDTLIPSEKKKDLQYRLTTYISTIKNPSINFFPSETVIKETFIKVIIACLIIGCYLVGIPQYFSFKSKVDTIKSTVSSAQIEQITQQPYLDLIKQQIAHLEHLAKEPFWDDVFHKLSTTIPDDFYLTSLSLAQEELTLKGIILSDEKEKHLYDFITNLENNIFSNVQLIQIKNTPEKNQSEFELKCKI